MISRILLFFFAAFFWACQSGPTAPTGNTSQESDTLGKPPQVQIQYAKGFSVTYFPNYILVKILVPMVQGSKQATYILHQKGAPPVENPSWPVIEIPVTTIACQSTTHLPLLDALGLDRQLIGFAGIPNIRNPKFKTAAKSGDITEIGSGYAIDPEKTVVLGPDLLMVYPVQGESYDQYAELGINVVYNAEYLEHTPLGKAEWLKFMALFFNKTAKANAVFADIEQQYQNLQKRVAIIKERPTVFAGEHIGGAWDPPGGNSFAANFLKDAGADYLWKENDKTGTLKVDLETVLAKAINADFWTLIVSSKTPFGLKDLLERDPIHGEFKAFKDKKVLVCNAYTTGFFENSILEPHLILSDLVKAFHPDLLPDHQPVYYQFLR